jgi:3-hydroxybutyryl-CoA dehydrogenase
VRDAHASLIGVIGAGAMGSGIAQVAATHGYRVVLSDAAPGAVERARDSVERALARDVEKGRLRQEEADVASRSLTIVPPEDGLSAFAECAVVIEAVVEKLDVKQATFHALEQVVTRDCVLATNTSSLSVTSIASACEHPDRVVGAHFFNPAPVMPLVEIVPGFRTAPAVAAATRQLMHGWKKTTVIASDSPGFIVNRIARPFYGEALRILEEWSADEPTIDWAMREIGEFRMGPFLLMDFIGLDVNYAATESIWRALFYDSRYRPSVTQRRLVEAGLLGRKTGRGFYDYAPDAAPRAALEDRASGERIVLRIVSMLINEAVDALALRVAAAEDIELAMTQGVHYPRGLLAWADALGLDVVIGELQRLQQEYEEDRYRVSPLLKRMAREGRRFFA